jgi:23S rRNA pseudouridine1911/1915/1917 synthase
MRIDLGSDDAGSRLDKLLCTKVPGLGRAAVKRLFAQGRVRVTTETGGRRRAAKGDVAVAGWVVEIDVEPGDAGALADPEAPLTVVLETERMLVLDKPAGQPTAPLEPGEKGALANALVARFPDVKSCGFSPREPGLCHRLDTDTSGLVLAARDPDAFATLTGALKDGRLDKRYLLVVKAEGLPDEGTIDIPLAPHPKDRRRVLPCIHPRDVHRYAPRPASTTYRKISEKDGLALVEARAPKALRHQIRAHFAAIDHPLIGDVLYGGDATSGITRQALHACRITWGGDATVPAFDIVSPLPDDIARLVGPA